MDAINNRIAGNNGIAGAGAGAGAAADAKTLKPALARPIAPVLARPIARSPAGVSDRPGLHAAEFKGVVRDMASAPPVDAGRVAALKSAITSGSYRTEPVRIADAMLASEGRRD